MLLLSYVSLHCNLHYVNRESLVLYTIRDILQLLNNCIKINELKNVTKQVYSNSYVVLNKFIFSYVVYQICTFLSAKNTRVCNLFETAFTLWDIKVFVSVCNKNLKSNIIQQTGHGDRKVKLFTLRNVFRIFYCNLHSSSIC